MYRQKLVIFPYNGIAIQALDSINIEKYDIMGFIDDDRTKKSDAHYIFSREILVEYKELCVLAVPAGPDRADIINSLKISEDRFIKAIHFNASLGNMVSIGYNSLIMAGVVLVGNVIIKNHVCIYPNTVIHHGSAIEDYSIVGSNVTLSDDCSVSDNCYIGHGSSIGNGIRIKSNSIVNMGTNIPGINHETLHRQITVS